MPGTAAVGLRARFVGTSGQHGFAEDCEKVGKVTLSYLFALFARVSNFALTVIVWKANPDEDSNDHVSAQQCQTGRSTV